MYSIISKLIAHLVSVLRKLLSLENLTLYLSNGPLKLATALSTTRINTIGFSYEPSSIRGIQACFMNFLFRSLHGIITPFFLEMRHCWGIEYPSLPPVTKKYDRRTKAKTTIADGGFTHPGFFSFKLGTSKIWKGIPYKASILNTKRKDTMLYIKVIMIGPALRSTIQWKLGFYGSSQLSVVAWGGVRSCSMIGQWIKHRYFQMQTLTRHHTLRLELTDASFRFVYNF